jgi:hypothetical protein
VLAAQRLNAAMGRAMSQLRVATVGNGQNATL